MTDMPNWEGFMIPTLKVMSDGIIRHWREFQPLVADQAQLSDEQKKEMLPLGAHSSMRTGSAGASRS